MVKRLILPLIALALVVTAAQAQTAVPGDPPGGGGGTSPGSGGGSSSPLGCVLNQLASASPGNPYTGESGGASYVGASAGGPTDGTATQTTSIQYYASIAWQSSSTPAPSSVVITYDIFYSMSGYAGLGPAPADGSAPQGGSASSQSQIRTFGPFTAGPLSRNSESQLDDPDPIANPPTAPFHRVYPESPGWIKNQDGGTGYVWACTTETVNATATASYYTGFPPPPQPNMQNPRIENDGSYAQASESFTNVSITTNGVGN